MVDIYCDAKFCRYLIEDGMIAHDSETWQAYHLECATKIESEHMKTAPSTAAVSRAYVEKMYRKGRLLQSPVFHSVVIQPDRSVIPII